MKLNYHSVDSGNCTYFFKEKEASYILPRICMIPTESGLSWSIHSCTSDGEPCSPYMNQDKIEFGDTVSLFSNTIDRARMGVEYQSHPDFVKFFAVCKACGHRHVINWRGQFDKVCSCQS